MYKPRKISGLQEWLDPDGIKIYTISTGSEPVEFKPYTQQLSEVKQSLMPDWKSTAAFVIFHHGEKRDYLALFWWGNGNELFSSVSVTQGDGWVIDPSRFSFCLYDMEVMWRERNLYIDIIDCAEPSLEIYRNAR